MLQVHDVVSGYDCVIVYVLFGIYSSHLEFISSNKSADNENRFLINFSSWPQYTYDIRQGLGRQCTVHIWCINHKMTYFESTYRACNAS